MEYYEIRCPCKKEHDVNGIEYERCGTMLGAIEEGGSAYYRCPTCGMIHAEYSMGGGLVLEVLGKTKINFKKTWRRIIDE